MLVKCACRASEAPAAQRQAWTPQCQRTHLVSSVVSNHRPVATPLEKVLSRRLTVWGTVSSRTLMQKAARNSSSRVLAGFTSLRQGHKAVTQGVSESVRCARCNSLNGPHLDAAKGGDAASWSARPASPISCGTDGGHSKKAMAETTASATSLPLHRTTIYNMIRTCMLLPAAAKNCWTNDTNSFCRLPARQNAREVSSLMDQ